MSTFSFIVKWILGPSIELIKLTRFYNKYIFQVLKNFEEVLGFKVMENVGMDLFLYKKERNEVMIQTDLLLSQAY